MFVQPVDRPEWWDVIMESVYHWHGDVTEKMTVVVTTILTKTTAKMLVNVCTRIIRRVSQLERELLTLPEHMSSPPVFSGVRVTRSFVLCVCFVNRCLSFCTFSFDHCVSSSIYGFWLALWYIQTLLVETCNMHFYVFNNIWDDFQTNVRENRRGNHICTNDNSRHKIHSKEKQNKTHYTEN